MGLSRRAFLTWVSGTAAALFASTPRAGRVPSTRLRKLSETDGVIPSGFDAMDPVIPTDIHGPLLDPEALRARLPDLGDPHVRRALGLPGKTERITMTFRP